MAIKSSMAYADNGGNPHTYKFTLWIAYDPGGGPPGTTNVNAVLSWDPVELATPTSVSPAGAYVSAGAGIAVWQGVNVDQAGTNFTLTLQCAGQGSGASAVDGVAEESPATVRPTRYTVLPTC